MIDLEKRKREKADNKSLRNNSLARIGNFIKEARLNRNESINELATSLKISPQQLKAIEEGQEDLLPEKVFVKAMVKRISEALKLDTEFIMKEFNNQAEEVKIEEILEEVNKEKEINKKFSKEIAYIPIIAIFFSGMIGFFASSIVLNIFSNPDNNSVKESLIKKD
ncbi:MAG: transcriptional regulator [Prochlorococcus sp. SP3034]|nr:transcriptional regulator [Prochlorococcus sp. SP3034]|tara:strand:+ start:1458 stop:1955 length:498 start_codon:yes stop_codon:yes gene_type:complete